MKLFNLWLIYFHRISSFVDAPHATQKNVKVFLGFDKNVLQPFNLYSEFVLESK